MTERPSPTAALAAFLIAFVGILLHEVLTVAMARTGWFTIEGLLWLSVPIQALIFALPAGIYYSGRREMVPAIRLRRLEPLTGLLIVLAAIVGAFALNGLSVFWSSILAELGLYVDTGSSIAPRTTGQLWVMLVSVAVVPALCEEFLFRGLLLPAFETRGQKQAVLVSGLMFALLHARMAALPSHLLLGIMLGWLAVSTGTIFAPMLFHAVYNGWILAMAYLATKVQTGAAEAASALPTLAESLQSLPVYIGMMLVWLFLMRAIMQRGRKVDTAPLAQAEKKPLTTAAIVLLVISAVVLAVMQGLSIAEMFTWGAA